MIIPCGKGLQTANSCLDGRPPPNTPTRFWIGGDYQDRRAWLAPEPVPQARQRGKYWLNRGGPADVWRPASGSQR